MNKLVLSLALLVAIATPAIAQDAGVALIDPMPDAAQEAAGSAAAPVDLSPPPCRGNVRDGSGTVIGTYAVDCANSMDTPTIMGFEPVPAFVIAPKGPGEYPDQGICHHGATSWNGEQWVCPPTPSPIATAKAAPDTAWDLVEQHGPIWGGMLIVFGLVTGFLKRNEKERWIGQGRTLAIVVAGAGVLGSVLEAGVNGGTWAGVIVTAWGAWKLMITPTTGSQPAQA